MSPAPHSTSQVEASTPVTASGTAGFLTAIRPRRREQVIEALIRFSGVSAIGLVAVIFAFLLREGLPLGRDVPLATLLGRRWYPIEGIFGLLPLIYGSLLVTLLAITIAVPLGLATAIYLGEMAPEWLRDILKPLIEILAGIPSIVLGFLGWVALAPIVQRAGAPTGLTAFTGGLILAYMALPTIISHRRGCARRRTQGLPRRRAGDRRHRVADHLSGGAAGRALRPGDRGHARHRPRDRRDDGGHDGDRQRRQHAVRDSACSSRRCAP